MNDFEHQNQKQSQNIHLDIGTSDHVGVIRPSLSLAFVLAFLASIASDDPTVPASIALSFSRISALNKRIIMFTHRFCSQIKPAKTKDISSMINFVHIPKRKLLFIS